MRQLTDHIVEGDSVNHQLVVTVMDEPGHGGACHRYLISGFNLKTNPALSETEGDSIGNEEFASPDSGCIIFQNGPIKEVGVNGITHESLLAILIDRLEGFQSGPYACEDNALALMQLKLALRNLQARTMRRIERGVEGTHEK